VAYDEGVAQRIRELLEDDPGYSEKKMFGGVCFLISGNMCCGVVGEEIMVRVGPDAHASCLKQPHARKMDFTGRSMKGMVYVGTEGFESDEALEAWLHRGTDFAGSLPAK
jgi:TfoX/Sxy family transcriptional regulator of competence genes